MKKMKSMSTIIVLVICLFSIEATAQRITGNGKIVTENRQVGQFKSVGVSGPFDVILKKGKAGKIEVSAEENLLPYLITKVDGNNLKIKWKKGARIKSRKGGDLVVYFSELQGVAISGSGDIVAEDTVDTTTFSAAVSGSGDIEMTVNATKVSIAVSGSGDIDMNGSTDQFNVAVSGSGDIDAGGLVAKKVEASVSGSGDVVVHATDYLRARVSGSGGIDYKGNPKKEDIKVSGSGEVKNY